MFDETVPPLPNKKIEIHYVANIIQGAFKNHGTVILNCTVILF